MFENHKKKFHLAMRAKRAMFTFKVDKKFETCGQTVLPDRSTKIGWENKSSNATF